MTSNEMAAAGRLNLAPLERVGSSPMPSIAAK